MDFLVKLNENLTTNSLDELKNEDFLAEIVKGQIKFLTVVESIQEILINKDASVREKGIDYLSWILWNVPLDLFKYEELNVIVNYYCDCLKGHHSILPATFKGLLAMVKMNEFSKEHILKVITNLFENVNCRTQLQPDRFIIYSILKVAIEVYLEDLKFIAFDFVLGLITFLEGETDPACLFLIFNYLPQLLKNFEIGHLSEEFFEVLSCYFPIDFNAAAKDNSDITRQDLAESLQLCLTANKNFCKQCLPLVFEKLESTFKSAKVDSYNLLLEACKKIKIKHLKNHLSALWLNIQKDILYGKEKEVCEAALSVLTCVTGLLSNEEVEQNIILEFLTNIRISLNTLSIKLNENIFKSVIKILIAASLQSKQATIESLSYLKPYYNIENIKTLGERKIALLSFLPFVKLFHVHKITEFTSSKVWFDSQDLFKLYFESAKVEDYEVKNLAYTGIYSLIPVFNEHLKSLTFKIIIENIKCKIDTTRSVEFSILLRKLAEIYHKELYINLTNNFKTEIEQVEPYTLQFLWTLSTIADLSQFTNFGVSILLEVIINSNYYFLGLESLLNACKLAKRNKSTEFFHQIYSDHNALQRLMIWWFKLMNDAAFSVEIKNFKILAEIIALIVRNQNVEKQQVIVNSTMKFFFPASTCLNGDSGSVHGNFLCKSSFEKYSAIFLLEAILGSVAPEVNIPDLTAVQHKLTQIALASTQESHKLSASRLLASIVNKSNESLTFILLTNIFEEVFKELENSSNCQLKNNCATLITWIIKGIVIKGKDFDDFFFKWFHLLDREDIGELIAEGFQIIMEDDNMYLNLESHCNVKVLYRQRIFGHFSTLLKLYENSQEHCKLSYLSALIQLLQGIPIHLIRTEISNVVVILKKSLETEKTKLLLISLLILTGILKTEEKILQDHINSFVTILLKLSTFEDCMKVRINALNCIWLYSFYPTFVLLPLKNKVIRNLENCLDDKKRLVRKIAVKARCRWFLVGAPGVYSYVNDTFYVGGWNCKGEKHGRGHLKLYDSTRYIGAFSNGLSEALEQLFFLMEQDMKENLVKDSFTVMEFFREQMV